MPLTHLHPSAGRCLARAIMPTYLIAVEDPGLGYDAETSPPTQSVGFSIATASWRSCCRSRASPDNSLVVPVILIPDEIRRERTHHASHAEDHPLFVVSCASRKGGEVLYRDFQEFSYHWRDPVRGKLGTKSTADQGGRFQMHA